MPIFPAVAPALQFLVPALLAQYCRTAPLLLTLPTVVALPRDVDTTASLTINVSIRAIPAI
jgi:hypothetical protein